MSLLPRKQTVHLRNPKLMAKFAVFLAIAACGLLTETALGSVAKRQSCEVSALPEACRQIILAGTIDKVAFSDSSAFIDTYCISKCAQPLYNYYKNCGEAGSAATFDLYCSSNAAGDHCLVEILTAFSAEDSFTSACLDPIQGATCSSACKTALATAYDSLGCCLYSFFAVSGGEAGARAIFSVCSDDPTTLCVGGASGATLQIPADVPPECAEFVDDVDQLCRYLLSEDITVSATIHLDEICSDTCGPEIYKFSQDCDGRTGVANASALDVYCAANIDGKLCGEILTDFSGYDASACDGVDAFTCPEACRTALQRGLAEFGCCLPSLFKLFAGGDTGPIDLVVSSCGIQLDNCIGRFSGKPAPPIPDKPTVGPTTARCGSLRNAIPATCQAVSTFESITSSANSNANGFQTNFCKSNCAKPVYEYINECVNKTQAAYIDFLCSETPSGTDCVNILPDSALDTAIEGVCKDATDKQCSRECQVTFQGFNKIYGCCLFTYSALDTNVTYSNGLWDECGVDNAGLCTGGITNSAINATGSEVDGAATGAVLSSLLLVLSLAFAMTL